MAPSIRVIYTHKEYSIDFFGEELIVTVTRTPSVINDGSTRSTSSTVSPLTLSSLESASCGHCLFAWYTNPRSESYYAYDSPGDTLQLCVGRRCLIIQLSHCDHVPDALHNFLSHYTHVGVWNSQDAKRLEQCRHQLKVGKLLDLRMFVQDSRGRSMKRPSFEEVVEECMGYGGVRLDPKVSISDWSVYNLCDDQILQASINVYACSELGVRHRLWEV